ncbi:DUF4111 domain-containing protein [Candidatus Roizmanbacteria bacterium]|nr:DUF4111 domain-containing protein [Candidatus Roizmanbacteria bacterium]
MKLTNYEIVNRFIADFSKNVGKVLGDEVIGIYLFGSLTYGDFNPDRSDIDLLVVVKYPLAKGKIKLLKKFHVDLGKKYPKWAKRHESSYTPIDFFKNILPPTKPRPYFGSGKFYPKAQYGNEWLINNYLLYKHGITFMGPDFKNLVEPINIEDVKKACIRDLHKEWKPKINDQTWLEESHHQAYIVLNLCRILYTIKNDLVTSKKVSASWVKNEFNDWRNLIETAENWKYGTEVNVQNETIMFIKFILSKI